MREPYASDHQMALLEKILVVKKSKIPRSGQGLFTTEKIYKGACIVEYKGRLEKWSEVKDQDGYNGYLLKLNERWAINALPYKRALGRFANDAKGIHRKDNLTNNAEYLIEGKRCFIFAKRGINPGEEILVSYGREYWNLIKRISKELGK
ncbi:MAG: SET domain-containing protein [Cyclobacteriaceae bacterium]